jgi:hypothetical protein
MSYFKQIQQNVIADSNNISTTNLSASETFTGTATSTLGIVGIQVSLKTDQNCYVYVDQSPDGTNWDIVDMYVYNTRTGGDGWTVQAVNSYVRVRVTNIGTLTTTYFRLQLALCPIVESVPRSLNMYGNLKVGIENFSDHYGFSVENTPMDEMRVVEPFRLAGSTFIGNTIDSNFWTVTNTSGGTTTQSGCQSTLSTNTSANGATVLQSVVRARYTGGSSNRFRGQIRLGDVGETNNVRRWGMFDGTDGAYFKLNGTVLSVNTMKGGIETSVVSTNWNGDIIIPTITNVNTYEIYITNAKVYYSINGNLVHTSSFLTTTWTNTTNLNVRIDNINSGDLSTNHNIEVRVATIYRLGKETTAPRYYYTSANDTYVLKYSAGILHKIDVLDNAGTIYVYDNTAGSGKIISIIDSSKVVGTLFFDVEFSNGLTIVTALGAKITVIYE